MDIKDRIGLLQKSALPAPARLNGIESPASFMERITRLAKARVENRRDRAPAVDLLAQIKGVRIAEGLIQKDITIPLDSHHGSYALSRIHDAPLAWLSDCVPTLEQLFFIDTETTGLAGGTGTTAFLVGTAKIENGMVWVTQYFMTSFAGERAMLEKLRTEFLREPTLVSFNGKSFDMPLILSRMRMNRLNDVPDTFAHIDLLHPTRALFRSRWPDCRLQTAEKQLLGFERTDDLPGHLIPQAWLDYVRYDDASLIPGILEHNYFDVLSMVALLSSVAHTIAADDEKLADPRGVALRRIKKGERQSAKQHLADNLDTLSICGQLELAQLYRRDNEWDAALVIWQRLEAEKVLPAIESLAKYHEHRQGSLDKALAYAMRLAECRKLPADQRRITRLNMKLSRRTV